MVLLLTLYMESRSSGSRCHFSRQALSLCSKHSLAKNFFYILVARKLEHSMKGGVVRRASPCYVDFVAGRKFLLRLVQRIRLFPAHDVMTMIRRGGEGRGGEGWWI